MLILLKLRFFGFCNFFFKFEKKNIFFSIGMKNIYFFLIFLKQSLFFFNFKCTFNFLKKNYNSIMILKSPIKYKISKHILTHHKNKFVLTCETFAVSNDFNNFDKIFYLFIALKKNTLFSTPLLSIHFIKVNYLITINNYLLYK